MLAVVVKSTFPQTKKGASKGVIGEGDKVGQGGRRLGRGQKLASFVDQGLSSGYPFSFYPFALNRVDFKR